MARITDRLSVRLSIVGAVLALGTAAIYYSVTHRGDDAADAGGATAPGQVAQGGATPPLQPIPPDGALDQTAPVEPLRPPGTSLFADREQPTDSANSVTAADSPQQPGYAPPYGSQFERPPADPTGTAMPTGYTSADNTGFQTPVPLIAGEDTRGSSAPAPATGNLSDSAPMPSPLPTADMDSAREPASSSNAYGTQRPANDLPPADPSASYGSPAGSYGLTPTATSPERASTGSAPPRDPTNGPNGYGFPAATPPDGGTPGGGDSAPLRAAQPPADPLAGTASDLGMPTADAEQSTDGSREQDGSQPAVGDSRVIGAATLGGASGAARGASDMAGQANGFRAEAGRAGPSTDDGGSDDSAPASALGGSPLPSAAERTTLDHTAGETPVEGLSVANGSGSAPAVQANESLYSDGAANGPGSRPSYTPPGAAPTGTGGSRQYEPYAPSGSAATPAASAASRAADPDGTGGRATAAATAATGTTPADVPGDPRWEGQQAPVLTVEKSAPDEIQVNRPAVFRVLVRNTGSVPAHDVLVVDRVPRGTTFVSATPAIQPTPDGTLIWQLGTLAPGKEVALALEVLPQMEGEIGSVAQVTFQTKASARALCTRPVLSIKQTLPTQVLIGQAAVVQITVANTGTGAATNVVLEADVPEGFTHPAGPALEHLIGTLPPGKSAELSLALTAAKPGLYEHRLSVHGDGELTDEAAAKIEVTAPQLHVSVRGPTRRFLDREAAYTVEIANPGTAAAQNVQVVAHLPRGMKYVTSDNEGQYDPQTHAVFWNLQELAPNLQGEVHVTVLPLEAGDQKLSVESKADLGLNHSAEHAIRVEGTAELAFTIRDQADPIEVGSPTTYEVRVHNQGSKTDTNIQLVAGLPAGLEPIAGDGPTTGSVQGQQVVFQPLARLAPDEEAVYHIRATGTGAGTHVIRVQLRSDEMQVPVGKEESTRVYTDR